MAASRQMLLSALRGPIGSATAWQRLPAPFGGATCAISRIGSARSINSGSAPSAAEALVGFGKHKEKTYGEMLAKEPGYCQWILKAEVQETSHPNMLDFHAFVKEHAAELNGKAPAAAPARRRAGFGTAEQRAERGAPAPSEQPTIFSGKRTVSFGKHVGKTFEEAFEENQHYCRWLVDRVVKKGVDKDKAAAHFALYVLHRWWQKGPSTT
mmetsp:Transcript_30890/g.67644  ORF Transcript_30890/g.67644 Transcript_30890/m.67644 type:complete len:211 (-) Transcript_30890:251-883(-)